MIPNWHSHAMILIVGQDIEVENSAHTNIYEIKVNLHWERKYKYQQKFKMWEKMTGKMCIHIMKCGTGILCGWWMVGGKRDKMQSMLFAWSWSSV